MTVPLEPCSFWRMRLWLKASWCNMEGTKPPSMWTFLEQPTWSK